MIKIKINKIILIVITKLSERDYHRFGCDLMLNRGYEVEVWDCSFWYSPEYALKYSLPDPKHFLD